MVDTVVYESPGAIDYVAMRWHMLMGREVRVIEPFHAYHHRKGIRFFPPRMHPLVEKLIREERVALVRANEINARNIYTLSAEKAVSAVESVFPSYCRKYDRMFSHVSNTMRSTEAENVFRKDLCDRLADFYSVNILLNRIEKSLNASSMLFHPDTNVYTYQRIKKLLSEGKQVYLEHPNIRFPISTYVGSYWKSFTVNLGSLVKLCFQAMASTILGRRRATNAKKRIYSYGVTIVGPRQLKQHYRSPNFIVDGKDIKAGDVVYFPNMDLTDDQRQMLANLGADVYTLPRIGRYFSNCREWWKLVCYALVENCFRNGDELMSASSALFNYFRWQRVMEDVSIRHLITHSDFGRGHIGRNLALNQSGVTTWYYTDALSHTVYFQDQDNKGMRHPFWTYLNYDNFVTWNDSFAAYYREHPGTFRDVHVVGCLWGQHIKGKDETREETTENELRDLGDRYVIACFDSTYSVNGLTSYEEGIAFALDILHLADDLTNIQIILKEKKDRNVHEILDPVLGPKLMEVYGAIDSHPRIKVCSNQIDVTELISVSDMVVSFPFTSTTFEAMSVNKPAIWHDPMSYYERTPYAGLAGATTHSYDSLKARVSDLQDRSQDCQADSIPTDSALSDPYRDGRAIDRFRGLLISS